MSDDKNDKKLEKTGFQKKISHIVAHFSAVGATLTCLGIGGVLVMDAATTSPTRFSALIEGKEPIIYPDSMAMRTLSLPQSMQAVAPKPVKNITLLKRV